MSPRIATQATSQRVLIILLRVVGISTDLQRYGPIIHVFAYVTMALGLLITGIDLVAGMPTCWTLFEGPTTFFLGVVILLLARRVERGGGSTSR